jgi:hypothetical protein
MLLRQSILEIRVPELIDRTALIPSDGEECGFRVTGREGFDHVDGVKVAGRVVVELGHAEIPFRFGEWTHLFR